MSINKIENKMLKEINQIEEGLASKILKVLARGTVKRAFQSMNAGGEVDAIVDNMKYYQDELENLIQRLLDSDDKEKIKLGKQMKKDLL
tara:strand:- start:213 stop:479 length:267 start_codon:yes stop_codon:yes gene_type:complete